MNIGVRAMARLLSKNLPVLLMKEAAAGLSGAVLTGTNQALISIYRLMLSQCQTGRYTEKAVNL